MKRLLLFILALTTLVAPPARAAGPTPLSSPVLTNFNRAYFVINYTGDATNIIKLNLDPSVFGVTTNITIIGIPEGISATNQFWKKLASGGVTNLVPSFVPDFVSVTNLISAGTLLQRSVSFQGVHNYTLALGANNIAAADLTTLKVIGTTTTSTDTTLNVDNGNGFGQLIILENLSTNVATFTMPATQAQLADASKTNRINGPWTPTRRGESIWLYNDGTGFTELGRTPGTNQTENLWQTLLSGGVTNLQPISSTWQPMIATGLMVGQQSTNWYLPPYSKGKAALINLNDVASGDSASFEGFLGAWQNYQGNSGDDYSYINFSGVTNSSTFTLRTSFGGTVDVAQLTSALSNPTLSVLENNVGARIRPAAVDGTTPFSFSSSLNHTTGNLVEFANNGTPWFNVSVNGVGTVPSLDLFPTGTSLAALHSTNGFNFNIDDAGNNYQWRLLGLGLIPQHLGAVLASATFPLTSAYTDGITWGLNGVGNSSVVDTAGNGSPEGVLAASVGSVYRDTNGVPGSVLYVKETGTYPVNTGWTALGGGGGGDTIWTNDPAGSFHLINQAGVVATFDGRVFGSRVNIGYLAGDGTSYGGGEGAMFNFGMRSGQNTVTDGNSFDIHNYGESAGASSALTNTADVYNYGWSSAQRQILSSSLNIYNYGLDAGSDQNHTSGVNIYNYGDGAGQGATGFFAQDIYNFGRFPGSGSLYTNNTTSVFNYGDNAGSGSTLDNTPNVYNFGFRAGQFIVSVNSGNVYSFGDFANRSLNVSNCFDIVTVGGGLQGATLVDSQSVFSWGQNPGAGLSGSFNNVFLIGDGATLASGSANVVELGTSMKVEAPGGFSSLATDAAISGTSAGWTNTFGKAAKINFDGLALTFVLYNTALTPYYTNTVVTGNGERSIQTGGKILFTSGTVSQWVAAPF